jgi:UDP-N-acetylglucosamine 2-epimerase (non-hydrolysing)/GDP/UDP-N,N'-diacetylbacillosamine 2-epimerase (hydrolysing)
MQEVKALDRDEVFRRLGLGPGRPTALVNFHPITRFGPEEVARQTEELLIAIARSGIQAVFTGANADAHGALINEKFAAVAAEHPDRCRFSASLGRDLYHGCLRHLDLMVGNSSSGIIEAPSYGLPVVNVGDRQEGRVMAANVLSVACTADAIARAMETARGAEFRALCARRVNPYAPHGTSGIGLRIKETLKTVPLGPEVLKKRFRRWSEPHA